MAELRRAVAEVELEDQVRVGAITGAGEKAFVAGADITEMKDLGAIQAHIFSGGGFDLGLALERSPKIWVAAVNGFALGGGCELALACDFIYASEAASFGQPEVKLGVIPGFGGTQRLTRRVGVAKAKELCVTGDRIKAAEALRIGLADLVVAPAELLPKVRELAGRIAGNGPLAVAAAKRVIQRGQSMPLEEALELERQAFADLFATADQKEGMAAFTEKRPAKFTGR
jgi:enoyl-CoA hydratase